MATVLANKAHVASLAPSQLLQAFESSGCAVWIYTFNSNELCFSDHVHHLLADLADPCPHLEQFIKLLSDATAEAFLTQCMNSRPEEIFSQDVEVIGVESSWLRFLGRQVNGDSIMGLVYNCSDDRRRLLQLETSEKLLDALFEQSPTSAWISDPEGNLLKANSACRDLFGLDKDSVSTHIGYYNLFKDSEFNRHQTLVNQIAQAYATGEPTQVELQYNAAKLQNLAAKKASQSSAFNKESLAERIIHLEANVLPVKNSAGQVISAIIQHIDLSREYEVAASLKERDQLLRSIINNTHSLVAVKNCTGEYLLANQAFCRLFDLAPHQVVGKTNTDLFGAERAKVFDALDAVAHSQSELLELEEDINTVNNAQQTYLSARFPIEGLPSSDGQYIGWVLTDISSRKDFEKTVDSQRYELRLLLDSIPLGIFYLDNWGRVKNYNRFAADLISDHHAEGKTFLECAPIWDDPADRQREIMAVVRSGDAIRSSTERAYINNEWRWLSVDKIPTVAFDKQVTGVLLVVTDIHEEVIRQRALEESESLYRAFIANSSEAIWRYDLDPAVPIGGATGQQVEEIKRSAFLAECNDVYVKSHGVSDPNDLLGNTLEDSGSRSYAVDLQYFVNNQYRLIDYEAVRVDRAGQEHVFQVSAVGFVENDKLVRIWGTSRDVTEQKRYEDKLEYQAKHDGLTDLPNRTMLYEKMGYYLSNRREQQKCALLLIDLDRFKEINDTLGHHIGDQLLQCIGPRLEDEIADIDSFIARLGGDEFAIFLPHIRNHQQAIVLGHRVLDAISQEFELDGFCAEISASIGITVCPTQAQDVSTMLRYADVAMYRAKSDMLGVAIYNAEFDPHSEKRLTIMSHLGRAIREDQLTLAYQPKIDVASGKILSCEALLRWTHPELGFVSPGEFIPIVEVSNLIHPLTQWVLENSIRQCSEWRQQGLSLGIAVNLSARNLMGDSLVSDVKTLLQRYQLPASALELEITESTIMADPTRAMHALNALHDLGVTLSIDDFGTGYSSLAYLKRLPVQTLKIDYSFVLNMLQDEQDKIIVNSTIHLAHNLGLTVVAEGVETQELLDELQLMQCDQAQGYFISRPVPAEQLRDWLPTADWQVEPLSNCSGGDAEPSAM